MWYRIYFEPIEHLLYKKITPVFLQNLFDNIENESPYIATICLKMWKAACNYAISKNVIADNKFKRIDKIALPKSEKQHITVDKIKEMLVIAKKEFPLKYYIMFYLLVGTGMRVGELVALTKSDFNHKECSIIINKQYTHGELKHNPKTSSSNRVAYMFKSLAEELNNYIKTVEGELLFPSLSGGYIDINNYRRRFWTRLKELTGVPENMRLHDLRGSFIDLVLSSGLSVKFAQNNVGHSKAQTTLDWYAQNNSDMVNAAMERFEEVFQIGWKNGGKIFDNKKSNILPFRKKSDISSF
jgi:integrase